MAVYRLPFDDDGLWALQPQANWDDPGTGAHQPYAFDFVHPVGGVIRAARGGKVIFVENHDGNVPDGDNVPGYGTAVLIRHVDNTVSAYNHLKFQSTKVVNDQHVLQGQPIALSGNTGNSYAPHLHFGLVSFWNGHSDAGVDVPCQFEDKNHKHWRPFIGDPLASNNSVLRQEEWRWCSKCQGLYYSGKAVAGTIGGKCPVGGAHSHAKSGNYMLRLASAAEGQDGWAWCSKCQGLFFGKNPGSKCPAGGEHTKAGSGNYVLPDDPAVTAGQANWRWCKKCQGLYFPDGGASTCPAGASHVQTGSGNYVLELMGSGEPQSNWRWCNKCQGLFFGGSPGSKCPAGGEHSKTGSGDYVLVWGYYPGVAPGQSTWHWCNKCQGLFFGGNPGSKCPAGGEHSKTGSGDYTIVNSTSSKAPGQPDWRWCNKCQGLFFGGKPGSKCPGGGEHSTKGSGNYWLQNVPGKASAASSLDFAQAVCAAPASAS